MGEVGTNSPTDTTSITMKMNGNVNGTTTADGRLCDDGTADDEQMDVDSQDDASITSGSAISHNDGKLNNDDISAIKTRIAESSSIENVTKKGDQSLEQQMSQDEDDEDDDDEEKPVENDDDSKSILLNDEHSNHSVNSRSQDAKQNGDEKHNDEVNGNDDDDVGDDVDGDDESAKDDEISKDSAEPKNLSIEKVSAAEVDEVTQDSNASEKNPLEDADEPKESAKDVSTSKPQTTLANGDSTGGGGSSIGGGDGGSTADDESRDEDDYDDDDDNDDVQHVPIVQEVHSISDSDDDDDEEVTVTKTATPGPASVKAAAAAAAAAAAKSSPANGHNNTKNDEDAPVSIHSDSDSESDTSPLPPKQSAIERTPAKNGQKKPVSEPASNKDVSDNEDCVLVEDDDNKKETEDISPRRSSRARKSVVKVRDFSAFDDDIEEVVNDPLSQPAAKKAKTSPGLGITIQDARSLADPLMSASLKNVSFQQQFINQTGVTAASSSSSSSAATGTTVNNNKKEPTLVIIDTNQIMQRGSPQTNSFGLRGASITPINNKNNSPPKMASLSTSTLLSNHSNLLPALTDDMFVLEAPSFIVPYIYEKPPAGNLKDIVEQIGKELEEKRKREEAERKLKGETSGGDDTSKDGTEPDSSSKNDDNEATTSAAAAAAKNKKKAKSRRSNKSGDDSWDESDESTDDEASDGDERTKILIKEIKDDLDVALKPIIVPKTDPLAIIGGNKDGVGGQTKRENYFESPLGLFFMDIGINLVQEHVQTDLLRQQKKKLSREGDKAPASVQMAINSLVKNLELSKDKNGVFKFDNKRCEYCNFKSESTLAMAHHYETPHLNNLMYRCNFCKFEARPPYDILFHMEAMHNIKARLEKAQSYHQCPNCPFEDNGKSKLARHTLVCSKKFRPEINLNPPLDWEPPAKIPRIKPRHGLVGTATAYQAMAAQAQRTASNQAAIQRQTAAAANAAMMRGRGRPQTVTKPSPAGTVLRTNQQPMRGQQQMPGGMVLPTNFQLNSPGQYGQAPGPKSSKSQQPSISITPLPRQSGNMPNAAALHAAAAAVKPPGAGNLKPGQTPPGGKAFVICEICDGYIKDLDQLRNHMQWMHKVKIHPKMIYNRPPLNCQKCQFRFFTDQGLERHLLGSHGLVTSSMQEAANKGKDAGRCPVCGRMYQWKLLNHVSRDHNMTLKPAHLSYKCTVCTATFGMYKQFENHVYSAHSTVAKKAMDNKKSTMPSGSKSSGDSLLKPLKINDEITIIPQPSSRQSRGPPIELD